LFIVYKRIPKSYVTVSKRILPDLNIHLNCFIGEVEPSYEERRKDIEFLRKPMNNGKLARFCRNII